MCKEPYVLMFCKNIYKLMEPEVITYVDNL